MKKSRGVSARARLACCAVAYYLCMGAAFAQAASLALPAESLAQALQELGRDTGTNILFTNDAVKGKKTHALYGDMTAQQAIQRLLAGTDLVCVSDGHGGYIVRRAAHSRRVSSSDVPVEDAVTQAEAPTAAMLKTVVVTATKRATPIEDIPGSVTAITGNELEQRGTETLAEVINLVPGVNLTTPAGNAARISIRGISGEANTNPTTGELFGDLSFTDAYVPHVTLDPNPFDLQDVEVLKGPQGTLYGAAALNGAIRYVPAAPEFGIFAGKYYAEAGQVHFGNNPWGGGAMVNLPLASDTLALRVVGYGSELPGWIDNKLAGRSAANRGERWGVRSALAWRPQERLNVNLTFATQTETTDDLADADNLNGNLSASDRLRLSPLRTEYDLASLRADYDFDQFDLVSETGYVEKHYDAYLEGSYAIIPGGDLPLVDNTGHSSSQSWSQEFRLVSNDDPKSPWSWIVGAFASQQNVNQTGAYQLGSSSLAPTTTANLLDLALGEGAGSAWLFLGQPDYDASDVSVTVKELAAYFTVTRKLGSGFDLSVGGRPYTTSSGGTVDNDGLLLDLTGFPEGRTIRDTIRNSGFIPKISLSWHPSQEAMIYALVSKGYRVGGIQWGVSGLLGSAPAPSLFKTDDIWNYETGLRSTWLQNTLQFNLTGFYEQWKDPQVLIFVDGGLGSFVDNVGGVDSKGVETSLQYLLPELPGLSLRVSAAYDEARTTTAFNDGSVSLPVGSEWPLSPKWQTAASLDYQHEFGKWYVGGNLTDTYISKAIYGVDQPNPVFDYNLLDAQVRIGSLNLPSQPELSLTLKNVCDKRGITTSYSGSFWNEVTYTQPRTLMLRLSGSF